MSLEGRVAIVTGAAQGIGRAIAETLAKAGADIVVADLDPTRSKEAVAAVEKAGRKALNLKVNVADANDTKAMAEQILKDWGKIDILVNNAGITRDGLLLRMKEEDWNLVLQVNLNGTFHCTKGGLAAHDQTALWSDSEHCLDRRRDGERGAGELCGLEGGRHRLHQDGCERICQPECDRQRGGAGIHRYGDDTGLAAEVKEALQKQIPLARLGTPADIANAVRFLVSEDAAYITGHVLHVNGGMLMSLTRSAAAAGTKPSRNRQDLEGG